MLPVWITHEGEIVDTTKKVPTPSPDVDQNYPSVADRLSEAMQNALRHSTPTVKDTLND